MPCDAMRLDAERRAFAAQVTMIEELSDAVRAAAAATTAAELGKVYETLVGYDLHADDPALTVHELRTFIDDYVREVCDAESIPVDSVGLPPDA